MAKRKAKRLDLTIVFSDEGSLSLDDMPWPRKGEALLAKPLPGEDFIYGYDRWILDDLKRLGYFALQYQHCARLIVQHRRGQQAENIAYVLGFLYRHAIELYLKDIIARGDEFRGFSVDQQKELFTDHSLHRLWNKAKTVIQEYIDKDECAVVEAQILQLHSLDQRSDGFRYPFGMTTDSGARETVLDGFSGASFEQFVYVLDGICNWLATTQDIEEEYQQLLADLGGG